MILVKIRCRECGRVLDNVYSAPAAGDEQRWGDMVYVHVCPWHHPDAGHGDTAKWQDRRRRDGKPDDRVRLGDWIPWSTLRPSVEKARRTGRVQAYTR